MHPHTARLTAALVLLWPLSAPAQGLPAGLDGLEGLMSNDTTFSQEEGPAATNSWRDDWDLSGFADARAGVRTADDVNESPYSLGEVRLQLKAERPVGNGAFQLTADALYDPVDPYDAPLELNKGYGPLDLRTFSLSQRLSDNVDVKVGRQILTWGTGDLLFINDMFAKDWNSFFIGRDEEYLKAPNDSLKVSYFNKVANLDMVYSPQQDADRFVDGRRLSYYNGNLGRLAGQDAISQADYRVDAFDEDTLSLRAYKNINGYEAAMYMTNGYWQTPEGQTATQTPYYPELNVYGASLRGPIGKGIGNIEVGYYDSLEDTSGNNSLVRNSELRFLVGYEQELLPELTGAVQWYVERMKDYEGYLTALPAGAYRKDKTRHVLTVRLTKLLMNQNLKLSLFNFYSPTDEDGYARPHAQYKINDNWRIEGGANVFYGVNKASFFGQFTNNNNVYTALRYSF